MTYFWRYDSPDGPRESPRADDQQRAEDWLSENWRELADQGVDEVTLIESADGGDGAGAGDGADGETVVYGPMSLHS